MWKCWATFLALVSVGGVVNAAESFGTLEFDGETYKVLPRLSIEIDGNRAFRDDPVPGVKRWSFDWVGGQPAFDTKRFECRVDDKPQHCLIDRVRKLPGCGQFAGMESNFIRISATKSSYGDTPEERGAPSAWSKLSAKEKVTAVVAGPAVAIGATVGFGAAAVLMSPLFAIDAVARPECVGWTSKWVEFDHDDFNKKVNSGFNAIGMEDQSGRVNAAKAYFRFDNDLSRYSNQVRSKITDEESTLASRNSSLRAFIGKWGDKKALPHLSSDDLQKSRWKLEETDHLIRTDYTTALDDAKVRVNNFYEAESIRRISAAKQDQVVLLDLAQKLAMEKVNVGLALNSWSGFIKEIQQLEMPGDIVIAATSAQQRAQFEWDELQARNEAERLAREKEMAEATRLREARERKERAELLRVAAAFRKNLKFGMRTNCGPVIEVRPPLVKVATPVSGYGNEHWLEIAGVYPEGQDCNFYNGQYVPPRLN